MDEPTRSLDPGAAQSLRDFIRQHIVKERGKTIFISTHNLDEAEQLCDRVAIFDGGRINVVGRPEELKGNLGSDSGLCDVFLHYSGKRFEERGEGEGGSSRSLRPDRKSFGHRGGFGMRKRGL